MENKMFCYQCQETAMGEGCTLGGVCGKTAETARLQDLLIYSTKLLSKVTTELRKEGKEVSRNVNYLVCMNLFATITNANFSSEDIAEKIKETLEVRDSLVEELDNRAIVNEELMWSEDSIEKMLEKAETVGVLSTENPDIRSLKELITYGLKGMAAYNKHANELLKRDPEIDAFIQETLAELINEEDDFDKLLGLVMETGKYGVEVMALLDEANCNTFGNPEITKVNIGVGNRPGILVSGHDLRDLDVLLQQSEDSGVDIYTHGEMLPAHYYPEFKKYKHFYGNYGNAWWKQREEFDSFNGPILMTTNCIVPPSEKYANRLFTTGAAAFPGCKHIEGKAGELKDFSEIIEMAKKCEPPVEIEKGEIVGGFAHNQVMELSDKIVEAVKSGAIKKFIVMAGCDGRDKDRDYYREFAEKLPKDTVILTAGCAKYRYNKLNLGDINGIPRVLDAGQCNDSFSLAMTALKLKEVFELNDINELPIVYNIAWYEQKAVIVLLALLYLGVKNIHLGPTIPAFLSPYVLRVLIDNFNISGISEVDEDMENLVTGRRPGEISQYMTIEEIINEKPSAVSILGECGMHCIGCPSSRMETLKEACEVHNMDVLNVLARLNEE